MCLITGCGRVAAGASTRSALSPPGHPQKPRLRTRHFRISAKCLAEALVRSNSRRVSCSRGVTCLRRRPSAPPQNRSEKIASIPKSLAWRMQGGLTAAGMETVGALPGSKCDSANMWQLVWLRHARRLYCGPMRIQLLHTPARRAPVCAGPLVVNLSRAIASSGFCLLPTVASGELEADALAPRVGNQIPETSYLPNVCTLSVTAQAHASEAGSCPCM